MKMNKINIINFIRACEPRYPMDLLRPVQEEMALAKQYSFPVTWLFQFDALQRKDILQAVKANMPASHECGLWLEIVQENVEKAGLVWRGRYPWDWHPSCGFSIGYTPTERERIADVMMNEFFQQFGHYPTAVGCWILDAYLINYLHKNYGVRAACICKDQLGTDGYTLWGGYWSNAYYPSRVNAYMPAQSSAEQIDVPIFRMLGSDPLDQYDCGTSIDNGQKVVTLEPVYACGGGNPEWVDYFLRENFREPHFALAYAQVGQENSFGAEAIMPGLTMQFEKIARLQQSGKLVVETLSASASDFHSRYKTTPVSASITLRDKPTKNRQGIWYLSKFQRLNLVRQENGALELRDWHVFHEKLAEPHLVLPCSTTFCQYFTPPLIDSNLLAPSRLIISEKPASFDNLADRGNEVLEGKFGEIFFRCTPDSLLLRNTGILRYVYPDNVIVTRDDKQLTLQYQTVRYGIRLQEGHLAFEGLTVFFKPEHDTLHIQVYTI